MAKELIYEFENRFGSINCIQLLDGNHIDTEAGAAAIAQGDMFRTRCAQFVKFAVEKTDELLKKKL